MLNKDLTESLQLSMRPERLLAIQIVDAVAADTYANVRHFICVKIKVTNQYPDIFR